MLPNFYEMLYLKEITDSTRAKKTSRESLKHPVEDWKTPTG
jgi:hypothetical protein